MKKVIRGIRKFSELQVTVSEYYGGHLKIIYDTHYSQ